MRLLYKTGPMESLRKWFYKPKRDDSSLLAQFFFADDALNMVAAELDSFDGRKDPERCSTLVNQLRQAQDRVLNITSQIMDQLLGDERVARGFRVKFPEDVLQDNLAGQLWFGAECLAAGSSIMNREEESAMMRPLAKALTRSLETVRFLLRERCLRPRGLALSQQIAADDMLHESLKIFDRLFAEFELCYVSAMVNVKTPHEFEAQQLICVLFSESLRRALKQNLLTQEQVDSYDPALMFAVPRLAIVSGLLIYSSGPLSIDKSPDEMSDMFRPFRTLLHKIRSLLWTLDRRELIALERLLATNGDVANFASIELPPASEVVDDGSCPYPDIGEFVSRFYADHGHCRELYTQPSIIEPVISESDYLPDNIEVMTPIIDGLRRLEEIEEADQEDEKPETPEKTENTETSEKPENPEKPEDPAKSEESEKSEKPEAEKSETPEKPENNSNTTETFHDASRKTSRSESSDLSGLRNLSTNGLMMFDPLVINAVSTENNRQLPDNDLVTSLNEQVTEIADRLSSIATSDVVIDQTHSFSANDVPTLLSDELEFSTARNEPISCMPSTSHGYLIPNAISHEPAVMSSLSHNNSAIFNQEDDTELNNTILNTELPLIIPENIDTEMVNTNITLSIANANLSSLLLTNEEYRENFVNNSNDDDNTSFHSAKMTMDNPEEEKVKFMLGYESDHESPADSGVSTENTSLDRSPDTDKENLLQDRVIEDIEEESQVETVNINYAEDNSQKNEAGASRRQDAASINMEARKVLQDWGMPVPENAEFKTIDDVIAELRKHREEKMASGNGNVGNSSQGPIRLQEIRRRPSARNKRRRNRMWSPSIVILDNRSAQSPGNPLRLNLDQFVDESGTSCGGCEQLDDERLAVALQAQEVAARQQARGKFKSSEDLIHRLFVCIAGVADQLQTNFAADLRNILKSVFLMNQTPEPETEASEEKPPKIEYEATEDQVIQNGSSFDSVYSAEEVYADNTTECDATQVPRRDATPEQLNDEQLVGNQNDENVFMDAHSTQSLQRRRSLETTNLQPSASTGDLTGDSPPARLPAWVPDVCAARCMRCRAHFTAFRRRHHCRNCGKVFCASCSSNSIPLPRYGQLKPVRVCEECFSTIASTCRRHTAQ